MSNVSAFQRTADETTKRRRVSPGWLPLLVAVDRIKAHLGSEDDGDCRRFLNEAISTGAVRARLEGDSGHFLLVMTWNFSLSLSTGTVSIMQFPGERFECDLHADDLVGYFVSKKLGLPVATNDRVTRARNYLVTLFSMTDPRAVPRRGELEVYVRREFGLGPRQFIAVRKEAIEATGMHQLARPGRRPGAIET